MILTEKWDLLQEKNSLTWKKILFFRPKMRTLKKEVQIIK